MVWITNLLEKPLGKIVTIILAILSIGVAAYIVKNSFSSPILTSELNRPFVDSSNGQAFNHELVKGETIPVNAPSGQKTGYPGELCYWTKDGTIKKDPTVVLLNIWIGKSGPTFCPDCGRLVVPHNPPPQPGDVPPPTKEEYEKHH
jgi:hypothetical protein